MSGDNHNQADVWANLARAQALDDFPGNRGFGHDCETCGPCADDHRIRQGCYDGVCCRGKESA